MTNKKKATNVKKENQESVLIKKNKISKNNNTTPEDKNDDSKQNKLILQLLEELPLIRTENYIAVQIEQDTKKELVPIDDERVIGYILHEAKDRYKVWAKPSIIKNCIMYRKYDGYSLEITELKHRIAYYNDSLIYDLCNGKCVIVDKKGWSIEKNDYLFFSRDDTQAPQVKPIDCKDGWKRLNKYLNIPEEDKLLLMVYIIACFNPQYTFPSVCINGASGSGKSTITRLLKRIIDPATTGINILSKSFDDLKVLFDSSYYAAFDNLSRISNEMSDFLCVVITGGTFTSRKKYENNKTYSITLKQGMCLNGIGNFVINGDLVDRVLFFNTKPFGDSLNRGEDELEKELEQDLPYIMGSIFELLSKALAIFPTVKIQKPIRLADFHRFGYAIAEAMGGYGDVFNKAISRNKERQMEVVDENFEIVRILVDFLKENDGEWSSTVEMLYKSVKDFVALDDEEKYNPKAIPKASNIFSKILHIHEADLAKRGFRFEKKKNGIGNKEITFYTDMIFRKPITGIRKAIIFR